MNGAHDRTASCSGAHGKEISFDFNDLLSKFSYEPYVFFRDDSVAESSCLSSRGPKFNSQHVLKTACNFSSRDIQHPILVSACTHRWHMCTAAHTSISI